MIWILWIQLSNWLKKINGETCRKIYNRAEKHEKNEKVHADDSASIN